MLRRHLASLAELRDADGNQFPRRSGTALCLGLRQLRAAVATDRQSCRKWHRYDKGIPVIVFERKTDSQKYTAFVSADNYEMGHQMGEYVVSRLNGKGKVMEILGLKGSSPADERHDGFTDALKDSGVEVVATIQGDWTEPTAYEAVKAYKGDLQGIDLVFGHNDRSAMGARKAFLERGAQLPLFCGIDGLPGENGGIRRSAPADSIGYPRRKAL